MKKIAIDAYYQNGICYVVGGIFNKWGDEHVSKFITADVKVDSDYIPGEFYKRELPGIVELLKQIDLNEFETIIIDGYVHLFEEDDFNVFYGYSPSFIKKGLGMHLRQALENHYKNRKVGKRLEIVGVAKTLYGTKDYMYGKCHRGESKKPLYITSLNTYSGKYGKILTTYSTIRCIKKMAGNYRIPTIIKEVDTESRRVAHSKENMFKQDYRVVVEWAQDGKPYFQYFRKGEPIIPTEEEKKELEFSSKKD